MLLFIIIILILILLFVIWTMLRCASIYDEIDEIRMEKYKNQ